MRNYLYEEVCLGVWLPDAPARGLTPYRTIETRNDETTMTHRNRISCISPTLVVALCLGAAVASPTGAQDSTRALRDWSRSVWDSARQGNSRALETYFSRIPAGLDIEPVRSLRSSIDRHHLNRAEARTTRDEARAEARQQMQEYLAAGEVSRALSEAVMVQTLSDDLPAAVREPDIRQVIAKARSTLPIAEQQGDWLLAQELLYRLNVLYEDTGQYKDDLDRVSRRLALLAHYAPRRLHDLRNLRAKRSGDEPLPEFNPAAAADWEQRVRDITASMTKEALRRAALEHIEGKGWRPLLRGALENLRLLATTPELTETFAQLGDRDAVKRWIAVVDEQLELLSRTPDPLSFHRCSKLLDRLLDASNQTIKLPPKVLYREFGDGAMSRLDQFSEIIWPDKLNRFQQSTRGSFVGVGILIRHDEKREIMVVTPLEGTPAYFGGIKPSDRIAEVNDVPTLGWSLNDAVDRITGPKGTSVVLGIRREGVDDLLRVPLTRDVIKLRSVKGWWKTDLTDEGVPQWDWFIDPISRIAYIRLTGFSADTYEDLKAAWRQITNHGRDRPNGLIVDLRYNPGGLLASAVEVSNLFVADGLIVSGEDKNGREMLPGRDAERNKAIIAHANVPTVILINQGSASASEIVAGCLQAHDAAVVIGRRSFGKGSVQTVHIISARARLKLTTQYYRLPPNAEQRAAGQRGDLVHRRPDAKEWGVEPDIVVIATPQQLEAAYSLRLEADMIPKDEDGQLDPDSPDRADINALLTKGIDPQLETALIILQAKALAALAGDHARADDAGHAVAAADR